MTRLEAEPTSSADRREFWGSRPFIRTQNSPDTPGPLKVDLDERGCGFRRVRAGTRLDYCGSSSNSMRRFCVRPALVLLSAIGSSGPTPRVSTRLLSMPFEVR